MIYWYPVHGTRYFNSFRFIWECSTRSTWYSRSPTTSTVGGGITSWPVSGSSAGGCKSGTWCTGWIRRLLGSSSSNAQGDTHLISLYGPSHLQCNFRDGLVSRIWQASNLTLVPSEIVGSESPFLFALSSIMSSLSLISAHRCWCICCSMVYTWSATNSRASWRPPASSWNLIGRSVPVTAKNCEHFIVSDAPLIAANSARCNHWIQSSCWWLINIRRYCSMPAFAFSVCPAAWGWNAVDIPRSMPRHSQNLFQNTAANWWPLSNTTILESPCKLTTSVMNNSGNLRSSIVVRQDTKCLIFDSRSTTTQISSNPSHSGKPVTK